MFSNNFAVAIKVNGKVLREVQDVVYLPFGTEYTILLKNTSSQKAQVKVSIDGTDVTEDVYLIVDGNESLELKRFIKNGNLNAGNAFKFIEKTDKIEQYRGNKVEDGLITIEYEFARKPAPQALYGGGIMRSMGYIPPGNGSLSYTTSNNLLSSADVQVSYTSTTLNSLNSAMNTSGITAPGAVVEQEFKSVAGFLTDGVKHSMTLQLKGKTEQEVPVVQAVIVKKVQRCTICGTNTKQTAKFCHECGASVQLV